MGGKLLEKYDLPEKRVDKEEYEDICRYIAFMLNKTVYCSHKHGVAPCYRNKSSHGDIDYLLETVSSVDLKLIVEKMFKPKFIHANGNVISFDFRGVQIDFVKLSPQKYDYGYHYLSYNDLHNFIGRIANSFGMRHGHEGLFYNLREEHVGGTGNNDSHVVESVILTTDIYEALAFLGFSTDTYRQGFDDLEDLFKYVVNSKYFNADVFEYENLNHTNRTRNRKRPVYGHFLDWLKKHPEEARLKHPFCKNKKTYLQWICLNFPHLKERIEVQRKEYKKRRIIEAKFNGKLVSEWTGLEKVELGKFLIWFYKHNQKTEWRNYVLGAKLDDIQGAVLQNFEDYKKSS